MGILRRTGMTLARLAAVDLSRKRALAGVQLVGLVTAMALAVALPLMQAVSAEEGLHTALQSLGAGTNLEIAIHNPARRKGFARFPAQAGGRVRSPMGRGPGPGGRLRA